MGMMSGMMGGGEHEGMMGMMSGMMGEDCHAGAIPPMAQMMEKMMPHCLEAMLPQVPKEARSDFAVKLVKSLLDNGTAGMTEPEKKQYLQSIAEAVQTPAPA
jgi:hypothetical protein